MDNNAGRAEGPAAAGPQRKKRNMGRNEWHRSMPDKRERNEQSEQVKRRKLENGEEIIAPVYATEFSKEDIEAEQRRPKKKVALLMGYSGTGYKGMQLSTTEKTIEGELFTALVAAGAISKANAMDPKKSSFVRCARTDKGVHAAGNVVSLKMIVEDDDIVQKINEKLSPQIRVWGIQVANKAFSSYQMCDSRIYEYLIPSHCFLPPHPSTYLGGKIKEFAEKEGDLEAYNARQEEVANYWNEVDEKVVQPLLESFSEDVRKAVEKALHIDEDETSQTDPTKAEEQATESENTPAVDVSEEQQDAQLDEKTLAFKKEVYAAVKAVKAAILKTRREYRIPPARLDRIQEALDQYVGTKNFHNYTIQKTFKDPSAKRHIKSFKLNREPILIDGSEWLSLKVHGQSFMMHQIRKMVAMVALVVRCGADPKRMQDSYRETKLAIPKAPGLGLLLERPIFDVYNQKAPSLQKEKIDFGKFDKEISEFKQREIYDRIFREEEETHAFSSFFNHIDHYMQEEFLYITSGGVSAAKPATGPGELTAEESIADRRKSQRQVLAEVEQESEDERPRGEEEG
ncbi:pseudouridine synthase PUS2 [Aspergillus stella-maris]|uniref:pseudouridine synthase PUS2 n=1 Tax=Aspergillus stella-maris TaxID=1810926 RepID=UPI003CCCA503